MTGYGAVAADIRQRPGPYNAGAAPRTNLFIGNVPESMTTDELRAKFATCGNIASAKVMVDQATGVSRGFAFVNFTRQDEAEMAISTMNGSDGMLVKFADNDRGAGGKPTAAAVPARPVNTAAVQNAVLTVRYAGQDQTPTDNLYLQGVPSGTLVETLKNLFEGLGAEVQRCKIMPDTKGIGLTAAMVQLASQEQAASAIEFLNGQSAVELLKGSEDGSGASGTLQVRFAGQAGDPSDNLYVAGVPSSVDLAALNKMFTDMGFTVQRSKIIPDTKGRGTTAAMVQVGSVEEGTKAIEAFNGQTVVAPAEAAQPGRAPTAASNGQEASGVLQIKFAGQSGEPTDNLYLNGLPSTVDQATLGEMFTGAGFTVQRLKIIPDTRGQGRCAAMVQVGSVEEAHAAIENFNGCPIVAPAGKSEGVSGTLNVRFAGQGQDPSNNLYLTGLPSTVDQKSLNDMFTSAGFSVERSKIMADTKGRGITSAMVQLASVEEATAAIEQFDGQTVVGPSATESSSAARSAGVSTGATETSGTLQVRYAGADQEPSDNLYLAGLPAGVDQGTLNQMFTSAGFTVQRSKIVPDTRGRGLTTAMVQVGSMQEAQAAIETFHGQTVVGPSAAAATPAAQNVAKNGAMSTGATETSGTLQVRFAGADQQPSDNLYLAGLPAGVDQATLNQMFSNAGFTVQRSKIVPDTRGRGLTTAMVQVGSMQEAQAAIETFHGQTVVGPSAAAATPAAQSGAVSTGATETSGTLQVRFAGADQQPSDNLYLAGLPAGVDQATLNQMFTNAGFTVQRSKIVPDTRGRGFTTAMVQVGSMQEAQAAIETFHGQTVVGPAQAAPQAAQPTLPAQTAAPAPAIRPPGAGGNVLTVKYTGVDQTPSDCLYVSGLPKTITEELLNELFKGVGVAIVRAKIIPDTKGFGTCAAIVHLASQPLTEVAIQQLNGQPVEVDSPPDVSMEPSAPSATQTPATSSSGRIAVKYAGQQSVPGDNLYITGLPTSIDQATLDSMFTGAGFSVRRSKLMQHGVAMVQLSSQPEAARAIETFNGQDIIMENGSSSAAAGDTQQQPAAKDNGSGGGRLVVKYAGQGNQPSDNLYLSGLPASTDEASLNQIFMTAGFTVSRSRVMADTRGYGTCTAMVQLATPQQAAAAIQQFNGQLVGADGGQAEQANQVAAPAPMAPQADQAAATRSAASGAARGLSVKFAGVGAGPSDNLYIIGLPASIDQETLNHTFVSLGFSVKRSRVLPDTRGAGVAAAMVQLGSVQEAQSAIQQLDGRPVEAPAPAEDVVMESSVEKPQANGAVASAATGAGVSGNVLSLKYAGPGSQACDSLFLSGLPSSIDQASLNSMFAGAGFTVTRLRVLPAMQGAGTCTAVVQLASQEQAANAIQQFNGRAVEAPPPDTEMGVNTAQQQPQQQQPWQQQQQQWQQQQQQWQQQQQPWQQQQQQSWQQQQQHGASATQLALSIQPTQPAPAPTPSVQSSGAPGTLSLRYAGQSQAPSENVYVMGLPGATMEQASLEAIFAAIGLTVKRAKVLPDPKGVGPCRAMVQLQSQEDAAKAISQLTGQQVLVE